jgi:recombinational DNA repair protein (RecF pathway)
MLKRQDAIILKSYDYRNTSKIIHILSSDSQRLSLVAKGARRTKSQFAGNIEPMNLTQLVYYIKPGKSLGTLKEASLIQSPIFKKRFVPVEYRLEFNLDREENSVPYGRPFWIGKKGIKFS